MEIQGLRNEFCEVNMNLGEIRRNGWSLTLDVRDLAHYFMPDNVVQEERMEEEAENEAGSETEKDAEEMDETQQ